MLIFCNILILLFILNHETVGQMIRGVHPSMEYLYEPIVDKDGKEKWRCLGDPTIELDYNQINDDYCDCPDGSDEPGTNACPYKSGASFYCKNEGHFEGYLESFKVNDGVCDYENCCDGSDEYLMGSCPNRCIEVHSQFISYKNELLKDVSSALASKAEILQDSTNIKLKVQKQLNDLEITHTNALDFIHNDKNIQDQSNEQSEEEKIRNEVALLFSNLRSQVKENERKLQKLKENTAYLEGIMLRLVDDHNPNYNDAAVKDSVYKFQNYYINFDRQAEDDNGLNPHDISEIEKSIENMFKKNIQSSGAVNTGKSKKSKVNSNNVDATIEQKLQKIEQLETDIDILKAELNKDYGPEGIMRSLKGKIISNKLGGYLYNLGIYDSLKQDDILIGFYSHIEDGMLVYNDGSKCWNGPKRSAKVKLVCSSSFKILSVSEPEKCEYFIELAAPIACHELDDDDILKSFKLDYTKL